MMNRWWISLAVAALLPLTACLDYEEVLTLSGSGSGEVVIHLRLDKSILNSMTAASDEADRARTDSTDGDDLCTEEEIRAALDSMGSGLELVSYRETDDRDSLVYLVAFTFGDYDDFRDLNEVCPNDSADGEPGEQFEFNFEPQADGTWLFTRPFMNATASEDDDWTEEGAESGEADSDQAPMGDEQEPEATAEGEPGTSADETSEPADLSSVADALKGLSQSLAALSGPGEIAGETPADSLAMAMQNLTTGLAALSEDAKNHKVRLIVNFPGPIIESNATSFEGRTAIWEYALDQLDTAPGVLRARIRM